MNQLRPRAPRAFRGRGDKGQSLAEFVIVFPVLALILLGVIEIGNAYTMIHALSGISREGANIAARGADAQEVINVVLTNGQDIALQAQGGAILTQADIQPDGSVLLTELANTGCGGCQTRLVDTDFEQFDGTHYAVEVFYNYSTVTPLQNFTTGIIPDPMYEYAVF